MGLFETRGLSLTSGTKGHGHNWPGANVESKFDGSQPIKNKPEIAESLDALSKLNLLKGASEPAILLFAAASALRDAITFARTPAESVEVERDLSFLCTEIGKHAFTVKWEEGRALTLEQAVQLALAEIPE